MDFPSEKRLQWLLFFGVAAVYALTLTRNYYWDGLHFALTIEQASGFGTSLLHQNHLIYNVVGFLVYRAAKVFSTEARALYLLQYLNCVVGAACVVVIFRILRSLLGRTAPAFWLSLVFAFSATWWKYATDADAYIISVFFLLISFYLLLPSSKPRPLAVAAAHIAAMCFHQLAVLFLPVVILGLYFQTNELSLNRRLRIFGKYILTAAAATLAAYAAAFYFVTGGFAAKGFVTWLRSYSPETGFVFNAVESLKYTFRSMPQLFFNGRLSFLGEIPLAVAVIGVALLAAALVWSIVEIVRYRLDAPGESAPKKGVAILCLAWVAVYIVFLFFFIPQNAFYRLFYLPALIVLVGLFLRRRRGSHLFAAIAAITAIWNFFFFIYPYSRVREGTPLALVNEIRSTWTPRTVVFYSVMTSDAELAWYLNPQTTWIELKTPLTASLDNELQRADLADRDLWVETILIRELEKTPEGAAWLARHAAPELGHFQIGGKFDVRFTRIRP